jgi:enediyne polyketide synthase
VPEQDATILRVAALRHASGIVDVAIRCAATSFKVDHFRARCTLADTTELSPALNLQASDCSKPSINPQQDLYGGVLFHRGRFQRVTGYHHLAVRECCSEISVDNESNWFARHLPQHLLLGDPGARDAAIHAVQACIPHARLVPVGIDSIVRSGQPLGGSCTVQARETAYENGEFTYQLEILDDKGQLTEVWSGLRLRKIEDYEGSHWAPPLLTNYIQRHLEDLMPESELRLSLVNGDDRDRNTRREHAVASITQGNGTLLHRPDGKPELLDGDNSISVSHLGNLTLAVSGHQNVGCDMEAITQRNLSHWDGLLSDEDRLLAETITAGVEGQGNTSATRLWTVRESLKKAGADMDTPLTIESPVDNGWVVLRAGHQRIASYVASMQNTDSPVAIAILGRKV